MYVTTERLYYISNSHMNNYQPIVLIIEELFKILDKS